MRTYYLFRINKNIKNKLSEKELYILLNNMYHLHNINYEISLYNKICKLIDVDIISSYLDSIPNISKNHNKYLFNNNLIEINPSLIIIKSKY